LAFGQVGEKIEATTAVTHSSKCLRS